MYCTGLRMDLPRYSIKKQNILLSIIPMFYALYVYFLAIIAVILILGTTVVFWYNARNKIIDCFIVLPTTFISDPLVLDDLKVHAFKSTHTMPVLLIPEDSTSYLWYNSVRFFVESDFAESTQLVPDSWFKMVSKTDSNFAEYSTFKVLPRYGPLRQVWLCAGPLRRSSALWTIAANLVMHYGPLPRTGSALLATAVNNYALWATAVNGFELWTTAVNGYGLWALRGIKPYSNNLWRIPLCGPQRRIWLCAMGHCAEFGDVL